MATSLQNNLLFQFTGTLTSAGTSVTISNDLERNQVISATNAYIEVRNKRGTKVERMKATIASGTMTTSLRGLDQSDTNTEVPALKLERKEGAIAYITILAVQLPDKQEDNTWLGTQTIEGNCIMGTTDTTKYGVKVKNLTTAQKNALSSPPDGVAIVDTTLGAFQVKIGGTFQSMGAGATTPNASESVTGKIRLSDQTQTEEQTTSEGGDPLVPTNVTINPNNITGATPSGLDKISFSDVSNSNKLRSTTATLLFDTLRPFATVSETETGTGTTQIITPALLRSFSIGGSIIAGTTYTLGVLGSTVTTTSTTYIKKLQTTILRDGTYTITNNLYNTTSPTRTAYSRIYKNGAAFGTERTVSSGSGTPSTWSEDLTFSAGDTIELWMKVSVGDCTAGCNTFTIQYALSNLVTITTY